MDAVIHIGMPKTGSTSIQSFLSLNREKLKERGIFYSKMLGDKGSQFQLPARIYAELDSLSHLPQKRQVFMERAIHDLGCLSEFDAKFATEIKECAPNRAIVSSEALWSFGILPNALTLLKTYLAKFFNKITICMYVRRQDLSIISLFAQTRKVALETSLQEMIDSYVKKGNYGYFTLARAWKSAFTDGQLIVRPYERQQLHMSDAVSDFCHSIDLDMTGLEQLSADENTTLDSEQLAFLDQINAAFGDKPQDAEFLVFWRELIQCLASIETKGKRLQFSKENAQRFVAQFADENKEVAKTFVNSSDGILFRDEIEGPSEDQMPSIEPSRFAEMNAQMLALMFKTPAPNDAQVEVLNGRITELKTHYDRLLSDNAQLRERVKQLQS